MEVCDIQLLILIRQLEHRQDARAKPINLITNSKYILK